MSGAQRVILFSIACMRRQQGDCFNNDGQHRGKHQIRLHAAGKFQQQTAKPLATKSSSTITMPVMARPRPMRMPAKIAGMAPGMTILRQIWLSLAPKDLAISMSEASTPRTPARVFTVMKTKANRTTMKTRAASPNPKAMITIGYQRRDRHGEKHADIRIEKRDPSSGTVRRAAPTECP